MNIKNNIDTIIVATILGLAIIISLFINYKESVKRDSDNATTYAIITELYSLGNINYFDYQFCIDDITYKGSAHYSRSKNKFMVGDTIYISYEKRNPYNHIVEQDN